VPTRLVPSPQEYPLDGYDTLEYFPTELDDLHSLVVEAMYAVEEEAVAWQRIPPFPEESDLEDAASPPNAQPRRTRLEMMHLREFHHHRRLVSKAVGRLLSTSLPDYSAELDAALRRIAPTRPVRRNPYRAAAAAARSGIADSLARESRPERAADMENDDAAARPELARKHCPSCRKLTTPPRTMVFFGECPVCYEGNELRATSCGHPVCKACWDGM